MAKKKTPVNAIDLAEEAFTGADEALLLDQRIARYGTAHSRTLDMLDHLREVEDPNAEKAAVSLNSCGNWLHFREYFTVGKVRLHNATFCKQHLICPLCAIRRGAKSLGAYLARWEVIRAERPDLKPYLLTLTVKNGDDLEERHTHLTKSLRKLLDHRRNFNAGVRGSPWTELCKAEGGVYTHEQTNKGKGWHPHTHMIILCASAPSQSALSAEWHRITGDSMIVDCRPITGGQSGDYSEGFMEVFKYAVKFSDLSLEDNWHAAQVLKGKRLLNSFGLFRGVKVPESLLDEQLDSLPYWDRFYCFFDGEYRFTGESPKARVMEVAEGPRKYEVFKPADFSATVDLPGGMPPSGESGTLKDFHEMVREELALRAKFKAGLFGYVTENPAPPDGAGQRVKGEKP